MKDIQGLYFKGGLVAITYSDAIKSIFDLQEIPKGFCINADHEALGYSIVDPRGVQHIYELDNNRFYNELLSMED